jgi:hypothetical protein
VARDRRQGDRAAVQLATPVQVSSLALRGRQKHYSERNTRASDHPPGRTLRMRAFGLKISIGPPTCG